MFCSEEVDETMCCSSVHREACLGNSGNAQENELTKLFHIKIQLKNTKIDALFYHFWY